MSVGKLFYGEVPRRPGHRSPARRVSRWGLRAALSLWLLTGSWVSLRDSFCLGGPAPDDPSARRPPNVEAFGPLWVSFYAGAVDYSPDGQRMVISGPGVIFILDAQTYQIEQRWLVEQAIGNFTVRWSPDGRYVAADTIIPHQVQIWDVEAGTVVQSLRPKGELLMGEMRTLAWSPDGRRLAGCNRALLIWDVQTGQVLQHLAGENSVAWSPDGRYVVTGGNTEALIYEVESGQRVQRLQGHGSVVGAVAWSPDGELIASSGFAPFDPDLKLWDVASGQLLRTLPQEGGVPAWSTDGTYLAVAHGSIHLWNGTGTALIQRLGEGQFFANRISWRSDNARLVSSGLKAVRVWDVASGQLLESLSGHRGEIRSVGWSPDGRYVVSGGGADNNDRSVRIWDSETGEAVQIIRDDVCQAGIIAVAWSPNGRYIAAGYQCDMIRLWEADTGREFRRLAPIMGDELTWDPQGAHIAARTRDDRIKIWEVESGALVREIPFFAVGRLKWSPDGRYMAASSLDRTIKIWEAETGRLITTIEEAHAGLWVTSLAWSPDSKRLASGGDAQDRKIKIWEVETGALVSVIAGHRWAVDALAWSPEGGYLASSDQDFPPNLIKVWDVQTGALMTELLGHGDKIYSLHWSPDGQYLASSGLYDSTVRVWGVKPSNSGSEFWEY